MSNGFLSIKYRLKQAAEDQVPTARKLTAGTYRYFVRGKNFQPQEVHCLHYFVCLPVVINVHLTTYIYTLFNLGAC